MRTMLYLSAGLIACLLGQPADAEQLNYDCAVGGVEIELRIDTETRTVTETAQKADMSEVARYSDGVFGPVSHLGAARIIPPVHQFVRIDDQKVRFGAELAGKEDVAVLDRRLAILTVPDGRSGWCSQIQK